MNKTRVLVVDDSVLMRAVLSEVINATADLCVIGTACNGMEALELVESMNPDVMTLDVNMPRMDGLDFLQVLMSSRPMPVVMVSGLTDKDSEVTLKALELGAIDFVTKPRVDPVGSIQEYANEICEKIRAARISRKILGARLNHISSGKKGDFFTPLSSRVLQEKLVLIGASTGGTEAIRDVLTCFPEKMPGILVVQHMPEMFTGSFARRLDSLCRLTVKEAESGERIRPGTVYVAPGHSHLKVLRVIGGFQCELSRSEPVNRHRPSVEVLFDSAATQVGPNGIGVMLTGMGKDGAQAMLSMRKAGCYNICQDQDSCVVWGMPREATINGAAHEVVALNEIPGRVMACLRGADGGYCGFARKG